MRSGVGIYDRHRSQEERCSSKSPTFYTYRTQRHLTQYYEMSQVRDEPPVPSLLPLPHYQQAPGYPLLTPVAYGPGPLPYSRPTFSAQDMGSWSNTRDKLMKRRVSGTSVLN